MAEDTPHDPTERHLAQLAAQGARPGPGQLPGAAAAAGAWGLVVLGMSALWIPSEVLGLSGSRVQALTSAVVEGNLRVLIVPVGVALLGVLAAPLWAALLALTVGYTLGGGTAAALTPDPARFAGWRRWTGMQAAQTGWSVLRTSIPAALVVGIALLLGLVPYGLARDPAVCGTADPATPHCEQLALLVPAALLSVALGVALCVAVIDVLAQRRLFRRQHRMTDDQLRREQKEAAPSPEISAERRRQQQLQLLSVPRGVARADVILRNPTHVAVGLRYRAATQDAPVITVSGQGAMASQIVQEATRQQIPQVQLPACARALARLEPGDPVPEAWFHDVAHVYRWLADAELVDLEAEDADDGGA